MTGNSPDVNVPGQQGITVIPGKGITGVSTHFSIDGLWYFDSMYTPENIKRSDNG